MLVPDLLRTVGPALLALATALVIDRESERRGLLPPRFRLAEAGSVGLAAARRGAATTALAVALWGGVFLPLSVIGLGLEPDFAQARPAELFALHALFAVALAVWYALGFGLAVEEPAARWTAQLGFRARRPLGEIGLGVVAGVGAWAAVLAVMIALGTIAVQLGGDGMLPQEPPPMIPWIAGLPLALRLGVSLSAGVVEETFFRGFLQPRLGIVASSALFVLAHLSYEQPLLLVGVTLLSIVFALLVRWRRSVWAAATAHFAFDALQLTVMVPIAMRYLPAP